MSHKVPDIFILFLTQYLDKQTRQKSGVVKLSTLLQYHPVISEQKNYLQLSIGRNLVKSLKSIILCPIG